VFLLSRLNIVVICGESLGLITVLEGKDTSEEDCVEADGWGVSW